jgi:hypothetical protein
MTFFSNRVKQQNLVDTSIHLSRFIHWIINVSDIYYKPYTLIIQMNLKWWNLNNKYMWHIL